MNAPSPMSQPMPVEREIAERIKAAGIRLRFDKVVLRLVAGVREATAGLVRENDTVIFTLTAPIRQPAKTAAAIAELVRCNLPDGELRRDIFENQIVLCRVTDVGDDMPRVIGFVHNCGSDAGLILALARSHLA